MKDLQIKQISSTDIEEFFNLYKELIYSDFKEWDKESKDKWINKDYSIEFWKDIILTKKFPVFGAFVENKIIGYAATESLDFGVLYLGWIGVLNEYINR
jgi:hypothetical protein